MGSAGIGTELEGRHAVAAALSAGRVIRLVVESRRVETYQDLIEEARQAGIPVEMVEDVRERSRTEAPQGVVAEARPLPTVSVDELVEPSPASIMVLDHIEDPRNVGAVVRSGVAAGVGGFVFPSRRAAPLGATAFKAAAGAFEAARVAVHNSTADALSRLRRLEVWTVGLAADADTPLFGLELLAEPVALVLGAEGRGLSRLVAERCDLLVHVPMAGPVESLNVSAAATLAAFEVMRVRG